mmetsp:Transcript_4168/g.8380  ORF Transcript_4168/g.8380 Transcript_4168/m.8380 type:complete len:217 (+) Transcript_4168:1030-1680(+)
MWRQAAPRILHYSITIVSHRFDLSERLSSVVAVSPRDYTCLCPPEAHEPIRVVWEYVDDVRLFSKVKPGLPLPRKTDVSLWKGFPLGSFWPHRQQVVALHDEDLTLRSLPPSLDRLLKSEEDLPVDHNRLVAAESPDSASLPRILNVNLCSPHWDVEPLLTIGHSSVRGHLHLEAGFALHVSSWKVKVRTVSVLVVQLPVIVTIDQVGFARNIGVN